MNASMRTPPSRPGQFVVHLLLLPALAFLMACGDPVPRPPADPFNGHEFVSIMAGEFRLGSEGHEKNPLRTVRLGAFSIAKTETTNAQFARFVAATGYVTDAERRGYGKTFREGLAEWEWETTEGACWRFPNGPDAGGIDGVDDHPVTQISWRDAVAYCEWAGGRLPTLDEWEAAAGAGADGRDAREGAYPWEGAFDPARANIWNGAYHTRDTRLDGWLLTSPVASFPPTRSGLYDVIGNVFEFCADDITHLHPGAPTRLRAARGGSWWCSATSCNYFNLTDFGRMAEYASFSNHGFRMTR